MCGITAYIGQDDATPVLLDSLERLEYRGYDSAGLAVLNGSGIETRRTGGRIDDLRSVVEERTPEGDRGIAHTRWATHGPPTERNAHPHRGCAGDVAVVHNGIIENAERLRERLREAGHAFTSDTDTEVLAHLIEELWTEPLQAAVARALHRVEGTFGVVVLSDRDPDRLVAARRGSPLLLGLGSDENFVASDPTAVVSHTRDVVYLEDDELAVVRADGYDVLDPEELGSVEKDVHVIDWDVEEAERGGYPHYMLKEINEQPESLRDTMRGRVLDEDSVRLGGLTELAPTLARADRLVFVACGTSWHAAQVGKYMLERIARLPVQVEYASEWRYRDPVLDGDTLVVGVSQSGETADTLAAIRLANDEGATTAGIVNVVGSSLARETDAGTYLHAGPEIGVASTKAFTSQIVALSLFTVYLAEQRGRGSETTRELVRALRRLPGQVEEVLELDEQIRALAERLVGEPNFLYLGRGYGYPVALEGALKLKEISYVHAEGMSAAEMKHGPLALIDDEMPVIAVAPRDGAYRKVLSNLEEVNARGGQLVALTTEPNGLEEMAEECIVVPSTVDPLQTVLTSVPLQLLAYHLGVLRGCDVDKPRNLAKSVTVE